jgi:hypothetical protein
MRNTGLVVSSPTDEDGAGHQVIDPRGRTAAHSVRPPQHTLRIAAATAGLAAVAAAIGLGTHSLLHSPGPTVASTITTAKRITVSVAPATVPLSGPQIGALLGRPPDLGALSDTLRRASCLTGLGYPGTAPVLGATPVQVNHRPGVLLVLDGDPAGMLTALAVAPNCSSAATGLLADTAVPRP